MMKFVGKFEDSVREAVAQMQTEIFVTDASSDAQIVYFTERDVIRDLWQKFRISMRGIKEYDEKRLGYKRNVHPVSIISEVLNRMGVDAVYLPRYPPIRKHDNISSLFYRVSKKQ